MTREEFDDFVGASYARLVRYGFYIYSGYGDKHSDVQHAVQETFTKLYRISRDSEQKINLGYALSTLETILMDSYRAAQRSPKIDHSIEAELIEREVETEDVETAMVADVRAEVRKLSLRLRQVVFLKYNVGLDHTRIGNLLSIPNEQVSRDLNRAHSALRKKLGQWDPNSGRRS